MAFTTSTQTFTNSGRGGYNGPASSSDSDDESRSLSSTSFVNSGRGGYNKGPDDDEEEDGRGGYN
ncbi:hypothetical protein IFR04_015101 [Cadophora malorum]|uniref:Uncharacterized protein n=1 Tax=Cadophora malorum TaxID=108018 RepID=A0A8H7W4A1_9HELO|nr:hypothetical protein IFR04_015101 [Cadophora malorum]